MAARKSLLELDEHWRNKIRTSVIIDRLNKHAAGRVKMSSTQVMAARILLGKVLPDLISTELTGKGGGPVEHRHIDDELSRRLLSSPAPGGTEEALREAQPNGSSEAVLRVALLGKAGAAPTNGHG